MVKRLFDLFLVVCLAPLWLPVFAIVAVLVRFNLGSPIIFLQKRPGLGEKIFELVKFRTMLDSRDAHGSLLPDKDRLPRFGQWLRSSSFDELPELLNVLRGEMSLVGPRPLLVQYLARYSAEQHRRHLVPSGITGWAQVNGRNCISWEERFKLDVWYVENRSLWLDIRILLLTIFKVLQRQDISAPGSSTMPEFGLDDNDRSNSPKIDS